MEIVPRSGWGAKMPNSVHIRPIRSLDGVTIHWFGKPKGVRKHADCPGLLRAVQRGHMAGEYSDIAYGHAVCNHGTVYELRGFSRTVGANGERYPGDPFPWNNKYGAIVVMIGTGQKPSAAALKSLKWIIAEYPRRGAGKRVITHGSITGSACPGPVLTQWVRRGLYANPEPKPKPPVIVNTPLEEAIKLIEESTAFRDRHPRIVKALAKLRSLRKKK
jgi:hypothetical protein